MRNYQREMEFEIGCERRSKRVLHMGTIIPFLRDALRDSVFEPHEIKAMSRALDDVCAVLELDNDNAAREVIAARIIDLARRGERSPTRLRDRVLYEAGLAEYAGFGDAGRPKSTSGPSLRN